MDVWFGRISDKTLKTLLSLLKKYDRDEYNTLAQNFRNFARCVGYTDTGYFRKRSGSETSPESLEHSDSTTYSKRAAGLNGNKNSALLYDMLKPAELAEVGDADLLNTDYSDYQNLFGNYNKQESGEMTKKEASTSQVSDATRRYNIERLKNWLKRGAYRNYMNSYYVRWNLLWPVTEENQANLYTDKK